MRQFSSPRRPDEARPLLEAEKTAGHSVNKCCGLFEVSRAAYDQRRTGIPSARAVADAELTKQIEAVHAESKGTHGSPRVHRGVTCGRRRVTRLMRVAANCPRLALTLVRRLVPPPARRATG